MVNLYKIIFLIPVLLTFGCKNNSLENTKLIQEIDSLDMKIFSNEGKKIYSIKSPNSSYDIERSVFDLKSTTIHLFEGKNTKYIINSDESKLSNNNKRLELSGNVKLKSLFLDDDISLTANNFIWNIDESKYLLEGEVEFENKNIILRSDKATLNNEDIIEFFNPVNYILKDEYNEKKYEINSENAFYNINTESLSFGANEKRVRSILYF